MVTERRFVTSLDGQPGNRADAHAVALGKAACRLALGKALPRLLHLVRREFRLAAHADAFCPRDLPSFVGALDRNPENG